jgi:hypothetical protein
MEIYGIDMKGKLNLQKVTTLPAWTSEDEGRLVYNETDKKIYIGNDSQWDLYASLGDDLDCKNNALFNSPIRTNNIGAVSANQSLDSSAYNYFRIEPTADITLNITNISAGTVVVIELLGAGDHTLTWQADGAANVTWDEATAPTLATGTGRSYVSFMSPDGVNLYGWLTVKEI